MSQTPGVAAPRPGAWLSVATPEPGFADLVVADITRITRTPKGRALLEQIRASGGRIRIDKAEAMTPPNAWIEPGDPAGWADGGAGRGCLIVYDPRHWPNAVHGAVAASDILLFNLLLHALEHLRGAAAPGGTFGATAIFERGELADYREPPP